MNSDFQEEIFGCKLPDILKSKECNVRLRANFNVAYFCTSLFFPVFHCFYGRFTCIFGNCLGHFYTALCRGSLFSAHFCTVSTFRHFGLSPHWLLMRLLIKFQWKNSCCVLYWFLWFFCWLFLQFKFAFFLLLCSHCCCYSCYFFNTFYCFSGHANLVAR